MARRILGVVFLLLMVFALLQCARRGTPSGGEKDILPPVLESAEPANNTINFKAKVIKLYFDEYIKLKDVQKQLIISPPLKYKPIITPQGSASKIIEIKIKDTLKENTTYTLNFGLSIQDNNEGNPNKFLSYVFSTGDYIDSLSITGVITDAYNEKEDDYVSVMLYEIDSMYTDSTIYKKPPLYITNTLDSTNIFTLKNLKAGNYALFALKDEGGNHLFDQNIDKIGYLSDTISLPTDSIFALNMFKEVPDFKVAVPSYVAKNKLVFGYLGNGDDVKIERLTPLPDSVKTKVTKEIDKDTLNYWISPFVADSLLFRVVSDSQMTMDTFVVKTRKLALDSLKISATRSKNISVENPFWITANIPIQKIDTSKITIVNKDTIGVPVKVFLDSIKNRVAFNLVVPLEDTYIVTLYPSAITDFFGAVNDTINFRLSPVDPVNNGVLKLSLIGAITYPAIVQVITESKKIVREVFAVKPQEFVFHNLKPAKYQIRVIADDNGNKKWDTGNYLKKIIPERVSYFPNLIEIRANWDQIETFEIIK